ncbi:MAG TPA: ATP-dependent helicase, partial [Symbiobacteriaceae bacterium]|nr:ATP-dependent helicase [Symbiobacteriaceae bacterium]
MQYPKAERVTLDLNHRCPPPVVEAANRLAANNRNRFGKVIKYGKAMGIPVQMLAPADSLQEAEEIVELLRRSQTSLSDWAVIYRTNQQAHAIAQVLAREEVPYRALGGLPNLYRRWPVQDVLCYLRAATGRIDALEGVINRPNRYISRQVMQEAKRLSAGGDTDLLTAIGQTGLLRSWQLRPIEELMDHLRRISLMTAPEAISYVRRFIGYDEYIQEYCAREGGSADEMLGLLSEVERTSPKVDLTAFLAQVDSFSSRGAATAAAGEDAVTLVTCHKAKGLEFPRVIVVGAIDKLMPHRGADDVEEERRLMYVAMTRAIDRLWISSPGAFEGREAKPSPFIAEALGPEAEAWLQQQHKGEAAPPATVPESVVRAVPKPAPKKPRSRKGAQPEPDLDMTQLEPGTCVYHERHGEGKVESVDPTLRRVIIDFGGKRMSLDLAWCLGSPQFFRVL